MKSLLIISENKNDRETYAMQFCEQQKISPQDIVTLDRDMSEKKEGKKQAQGIGIDIIKQMQEKLYLKPMKSKYKAIVIHNAQLLTAEAQNAMLKVLEEPPDQTFFLLTTESRETLLPTILSRCTIVQLGMQKSITEEEREYYQKTYNAMQNLSITKALKLAEAYSKNKEEITTKIEKLILLLREKLLVSQSTSASSIQLQLVHTTQNLQKTLTIIKTTNSSPRLALEVFFLSITRRE